MGRVLRKHGEQRPHFHHFISMPDENYVPGLDSKEYVQELNWVRELGEMIGVQPTSTTPALILTSSHEPNNVATNSGRKTCFEELEIETVQGNVQLEELLNALTFEATTEPPDNSRS